VRTPRQAARFHVACELLIKPIVTQRCYTFCYLMQTVRILPEQPLRRLLRSWDHWLRARGRRYGGVRYCGTEIKEGREGKGVKPLFIHEST
jgi:hypothetical protein